MFDLEIKFVGDADGCTVIDKVRANFIATVSTVCKYLFSCEVNPSKQIQSLIGIVNVSGT